MAAVAMVAVCAPTSAHAQVRVKADVSCTPTSEDLQYDCIITLANSRTNQPLPGLALTVAADMPSMPGMHNVPPVSAAEDQDKGRYRARIELEMHGVWALRLDVSGVVRDRVIKTLRFDSDRVGEPTPVQPPGRLRAR
jgi:hypothetical protein